MKMTLGRLMVFQEKGKIEDVRPPFLTQNVLWLKIFVFNASKSNAIDFKLIQLQMRKI